MQTHGSRRAEAGVTLIEILVVLALFAIVAGAVVLSIPARQSSTQSDLNFLTLKTRLDAAIDQSLSVGVGFGVWQSENDIVLLQLDDDNWTPSPDRRQNPPKLFARYARISFRVDEDAVFAVSPALVPQSGRALHITLAEGPELSFDGLHLLQLEKEDGEHAKRNR